MAGRAQAKMPSFRDRKEWRGGTPLRSEAKFVFFNNVVTPDKIRRSLFIIDRQAFSNEYPPEATDQDRLEKDIETLVANGVEIDAFDALMATSPLYTLNEIDALIPASTVSN
jgi:hypothetical protein